MTCLCAPMSALAHFKLTLASVLLTFARRLADNLLAIQEGVHEEETGHWHPVVYEIKVNDDMSLETVNSCKMDFDLPAGDKKGLEVRRLQSSCHCDLLSLWCHVFQLFDSVASSMIVRSGRHKEQG